MAIFTDRSFQASNPVGSRFDLRDVSWTDMFSRFIEDFDKGLSSPEFRKSISGTSSSSIHDSDISSAIRSFVNKKPGMFYSLYRDRAKVRADLFK